MLKQLIQRLLDSRTTPSEASHSSYPDDGTVTQFSPSATSVSSWTKVVDSTIAPTDGFACINFTADTATCIASVQAPNVNVFTTPQVVGDVLLCACPIAKGQVFTLCARQAKNIECWFTKTIGGSSS